MSSARRQWPAAARHLPALALLLCGSHAVVRAESLAGDSRAGEELLRVQSCTVCHELNREGARAASDLGKRVGRDHSPSSLVSVMWNHGRSYWPHLAAQGVRRPQFTEQQVTDLLAFAFSRRYFEQLGDAARGRRVFVAKRCSSCHGIESAQPGGAPPVAAWDCLADPVALSAAMWEHGPNMLRAHKSRNVRWAELSRQELTDLLLYLQNLPETRGKAMRFALGPAAEGRSLFQLKGCSACHDSGLPFEAGRARLSMAGMASSMWNHGLKALPNAPSLSQADMGAIAGYLWSLQLFVTGDAREGERLFSNKGCGSCHRDPSTNPVLNTTAARYGKVDAIATSAALWNHQPEMFEAMAKRSGTWPTLTGREMANLLAFLSRHDRPAGPPELLVQRSSYPAARSLK